MYAKKEIENLISSAWASGVLSEEIAKKINELGFKTERGLFWSGANVSKYARKVLNLDKRRNRPSGIIKNKNQETPGPENKNNIIPLSEIKVNEGVFSVTNLEEEVFNKVDFSEIKTITFNNIEMLAIKGSDNNIYVALKKICFDLGLEWSSQLQKIKRKGVLTKGMVTLNIPYNNQGNFQNTTCMNVDYLPLYLSTIEVNMCKEEIKEKLLDFQLKAKDILVKAFIKKDPLEETKKALPSNYLEALKQLVQATEESQKINEENKRLTEENQVFKPKALLLDVFTETTQLKSIRQLGYKLQPYGLGPSLIFKFLRDKKVLTKTNGVNYPQAKFRDHFFIETVKREYTNENGIKENIAFDVLKIRPSFYAILAGFLVEENYLTLKEFNKIDFNNVPEENEILNLDKNK